MKRMLIIPLVLAVASTFAQQQRDPALTALMNEKDASALSQQLAVLGSGTEKDLSLVIEYYRAIRQVEKLDSAQNVALKRYPKGRVAEDKLINDLYKEKDLAKKETMLATYKKDFPLGNIDRVYNGILYTLAKEKEHVPTAIKYMRLIQDPNQRLTAAYHVGVNVAGRSPELGGGFLKEELERFKAIETTPADGSAKASQDKLLYSEMKDAYGTILIYEKNDQLALPYIKSAYEFSGGKNTDKAKVYALLLYRLRNYQEAFPILDKLVKAGQGNAELKKTLADTYAKLNPGKDGAAYVAQVEIGISEKIASDYLKKVMNKPSPAFTVKDVKGKNVSLADFKGKTIVIDFWATWCGPCKKSFPAMQLAVNKYKNDPNVKFLFIHTWEETNTPLEDAKSYLAANHYSFDLYIDPKDTTKKTTSNIAVDAFGVKGIPQKFIIDAKGNIRFNVTGFHGGDDAAVVELSNMIEYAKNN
ncbi:redoxin domain-containing protein [Pedobacter sp. PWIIR3]